MLYELISGTDSDLLFLLLTVFHGLIRFFPYLRGELSFDSEKNRIQVFKSPNYPRRLVPTKKRKSPSVVVVVDLNADADRG